MPTTQTLLDKIWALHSVITPPEGGQTLLYVDRNFVHEESIWAFDAIKDANRSVFRPHSNFAFSDHYVPTRRRELGTAAIPDPEVRGMLLRLAENALRERLRHFGLQDPQQGIMHVVAGELGLVLPGFIVTGSDSHICTNGAFGALAFGVGQSELKQVFLTQTAWRQQPRSMRVVVDAELARGVSAKDLVLAIIAQVGSNGGAGYVVEYTGACIDAMTIEQRMTICNMSIEMGSQSGIVPPDETTFAHLARCEAAPKGAHFDEAVSFWTTLRADADAVYDRELRINAAAVEPMVTWGTTLEDVAGIDGVVPDPAWARSPEQKARMERALRYMGLAPGMGMAEIPVDLVFIGSCTNSRLADLRAAAAIVNGRRAVVPSIVSPGSTSVKRQAEAEGLDEIFKAAGFEWRASGCSLCVGSNGDTVASGMRCASSSPRNFEGRQGRGARTHVMSPEMAAAAAVTGRITDVRRLIN